MPALDGVGGNSSLPANRISGREDVLILASFTNPLIALAFGGDLCGNCGALLLPGLEEGFAIALSTTSEAFL